MAKVGIVGLGIMGSAYAKNLIAGGIDVEGADPEPSAQQRLSGLGGRAHDAVGSWLATCDLVILALLSPAVLREICSQLTEILADGTVVLETGTFSLDDKMAAQAALATKNIHLLDCPVSGTGAQAREGDILMIASGDAKSLAYAHPFIRYFTKGVIEAGAFGMGSRLKFVANHAVALHNVAAAETLSYSDALGLDRQTTYEMLSTGAGQSKMSDLRMPLMISGAYDPPTASLKMFQKDLSVIGDDLRRLGLTVPLFDAVNALYKTASDNLPETHDTASVFEVYRTNKQ